MPTVIEFLGRDPRETPETLGGRLKAARTGQGLTQYELADLLALDQGTVSSVEQGRRVTGRVREVVEGWLDETVT